MSKSEKLAALIETIKTRCLRNGEVYAALRTYQDTPDDPPQPPEMPECVRHAVEVLETEKTVGRSVELHAAKAVRDHYANPLKLDVGKCYEDAGGNVVSIVWQDPKFASHLVGVVRLTGEPRRYSREGSCCDPNCEGIIREVKS